ncbi:MAG TPA: DUF378 domain-containing protein [Baekduia sp.]|nr:DUF378 domain-containing protein [Baekduia sp.]
MEFMKRFEPFALALLILGGISGAVSTLFDTNIITSVVGTGSGADVVYVLIGLSALMLVPKLLDDMHVSSHEPHAHSA